MTMKRWASNCYIEPTALICSTPTPHSIHMQMHAALCFQYKSYTVYAIGHKLQSRYTQCMCGIFPFSHAVEPPARASGCRNNSRNAQQRLGVCFISGRTLLVRLNR